ncbi:hypothetical protein LVD15_00245 [Fulvivirga maritima]|uniref:hypothetical protein n=1 Tax=Fulvivirga maritima TaxID=2904247 RepID=UPI001F46F4C5|nr:hypothetical protein [Fulvivirga maritima]UII26901.1 hypothetical protein LVD15_00245 [Fulvivirga maritima]
MFTKELTEDNELLLYQNGQLIYKRWLNTGQSKVFDVMAYDKYTYSSITDLDIENSKHLIKVNAVFRLTPTKEGGRKSGIISGYRPNHVFEYRENGEMVEAFMGDIQFDHPKVLEPGVAQMVVVRFLLAQRIERFLEPGREWFIHEAPTKVGTARIIDFQLPRS